MAETSLCPECERANPDARAALAADETESEARVKTYVDDSVPDLHEDEPAAWTESEAP
jgi:hypothetical protein